LKEVMLVIGLVDMEVSTGVSLACHVLHCCVAVMVRL